MVLNPGCQNRPCLILSPTHAPWPCSSAAHACTFHSCFWCVHSFLLRSRYLANKCSIASRIDCFLETNTDAFGQKLKDQVG